MSTTVCWCGNEHLVEFSPDYYRCPACETLVWKHSRLDAPVEVGLDEGQFYGKDYFLAHQTQRGLPDLSARARSDLNDRCPYWLQELLQFSRPPARVLEIGSSHGAFVSLLNQAGFSAEGIDLSPWVVDFSRQTFGIPAQAGPLESHRFPPASFDIIVMNDVIEHLPDPLSTLRTCAQILKPHGLIMIQTPAYPPGESMAELKANQRAFLGMLIPEEHLYLFSRQSLKQLLTAAGLPHVIFEPPYFSLYDMFCFASGSALDKTSPADVESALLATPGGRHALTVIDAIRQKNGLLVKIQELDEHILWLNEQGGLLNEQIGRLNEEKVQLKQNIAGLGHDLQQSQSDLTRVLAEKERFNQLIEQYRGLIRILRQTKVYRALSRVGQFKWVNDQFDQREKSQPTTSPSPAMPLKNQWTKRPQGIRRILIDLTPILPGGTNGGAKIMTLELVRLLSQDLAPQWEYILFTAEASHEELAYLDRENVTRICVYNAREGNVIAGITPAATHLSTARHLMRGVASRLPGSLHRQLASLYQQVAAQPAMTSLLEQIDPDLVFAPFSAPFYYHPDIPIILVIHDLQFLYYPEFFSHEDLDNLGKHFHQTCQVATQIITISEYSRKTILDQSAISASKVTCIYHTEINPIGRPNREETQTVLSRYGLGEIEYIFFPANFWPHKNHAMLLTAFQMFCRRHPDSNLRLVLTGAPGERMDFMRTAVHQMALQERVIFAGFVSSVDYGCLLNGCKAMIFPSLFEGFGLPVLEAMRFGKPVFCSSTTSLPEVGGDAAGAFDPRRPLEILKALETIAYEPQKLELMAQKSALQAARFPDVLRWAAEYLKVFTQIMDGESNS